MTELIDTTEMYLRTILELEEEGITPLRARIVERLDHSGPTVSQTVARMELDGLIKVADDRSLQLTRDNAAALGLANVTALRPEEVPADAEFDLIWSNPPIRIGKAALHELLARWLDTPPRWSRPWRCRSGTGCR